MVFVATINMKSFYGVILSMIAHKVKLRQLLDSLIFSFILFWSAVAKPKVLFKNQFQIKCNSCFIDRRTSDGVWCQ